jgi:hypothetical protein
MKNLHLHIEQLLPQEQLALGKVFICNGSDELM